MEVICGIYKITSPKGKIYIGQSINIYSRWKSYKKLRCESQPKIYNSLKKHGVDNHVFEIIVRCNKKDLNDFELFYIDLYQSCKNDIGLNCDRSIESKLKSYQLEFNKRRLNNERKIKKRAYSRRKREEKEEMKKVSVKYEFFTKANNEIVRVSAYVGFMQLFPKSSISTNKCVYPSPFPF